MNIGINLSITGTIVLNPPVSEPAETLGPELVTDGVGGAYIGGFDSATGFTIGAAGLSWSIADGVATASEFDPGTILVPVTHEAIEVGQTYRVTYTIVSISAGTVRASVGGTGGAIRSSPGTHTEDITAISTSAPGILNSETNAVIDDWHVNKVL